MQKKRITQRQRRHTRLRKKVSGTEARPRLCVHRSLSNLSVQIIDDSKGKTIVSMSTFEKNVSEKVKYGGNVKAAAELGKLLADKAKAKGITTVVFDRGGYQFHGRVKAFAEACRKEGLVF
ncbi:50S ribosomal protein L18 [Candidatus Omnitrophota bacterium]